MHWTRPHDMIFFLEPQAAFTLQASSFLLLFRDLRLAVMGSVSYTLLHNMVIQAFTEMESFIEKQSVPDKPADLEAWTEMWKAISGFKKRMYALENAMKVDEDDEDD